MKKGNLIAIEGTDGSGKKTQTALLLQRLKRSGIKAISASFPQYGKKSAGPVEEYLNGKYGDAAKVSPYAASLFYAVDRLDFSRELRDNLRRGFTVVLDRYVNSNAAHQGGKIKNQTEREKFITWLYDIEYKILGIPKPNATIILHVPAKIGQRLVTKKKKRAYLKGGRRKDGLEANLSHLKAAEESYLWLAKKFPKNHRVIECLKRGTLLSPEEIHAKVFAVLKTRGAIKK